MGLHLGWIPNEPGLRPRDFGQSAPSETPPDPAKVAALHAAQHARALWTRMLVAVGLFALVLFGLIAELARVRWAWAVAGGLAVCCWLPVALLGRNRRRAAARLRTETDLRARQHAAELAEYSRGKALWARLEADRIATAPRWLQVAAHEDTSRLDVFGGTGSGRRNMVTGLGLELLSQHAVIVLDLSQDQVADGLLRGAAAAGFSCQDYELPRDLAVTPLLAGLSGEQIASLIVEVVHADDTTATAAGRATDLMILKKITGVLGSSMSMARLHAALIALLGDADAGGQPPDGAPAHGEGLLSGTELAALRALFGDGFRHQVAGTLVRLAAVVDPLTALGTGSASRPAARLTCLTLDDGPRDVAADLTAALVVQWVTRAVSAAGDATADDGAARPAVILAGADEQSTRHLARLTAVCERYGIPLVRAFARLTDESARHLDTRHTAFMRLATRAEAVRAAEHIGLERRFVAGRFAHRHSVSRSQTRTTSESVTHTTGRTEGGATTRTVGTTTGEAYSEAQVPRHDQQVQVNVENGQPRENRGSADGRGPASGAGSGGRAPDGKQRGAGAGDSGRGRTGSRPDNGGRFSRVQVAAGKSRGRAAVDIVKTRTRFAMRHESEATTKSWSATEEDSRTSATSLARTDAVEVGDEIGYELVYDHRVQPETLMSLPEDQMLAPQIVESAADGTAVGAAGLEGRRAVTESKMVALIIDPAVVDGHQVAPVHPGEIPAFEPPAPQISAHVPDYARASRPALDR
jgi:hypothetical protein